mgnify:CR=1 FL=1
MSKLYKVFFILLISVILISNCMYVFAAVNMNLDNNTTNSNSSNTSNTNGTNTNATGNTNRSTSTTAVSTSQFDLQLTNILSICLIVVGVLLILLGIAILIRLKK